MVEKEEVNSATSLKFYETNSQMYAEIADALIQSTYIESSHPGLKTDLDLVNRLTQLVPTGCRGLDAGCGAGARDTFSLYQEGYDVIGLDAVEENVAVSHKLHPELRDRVRLGNIAESLPFLTDSFDFILCNSVIQHISPQDVSEVTLPEFARLLKVGGVLLLMFKVGKGVASIYDKDYGMERTFQLYEVDSLISRLKQLNLDVIAPEGESLGGVMYFTDPKPMRYCVFFAEKVP